jgi:DNA repair protein RAD16
MRNSEFSLNPVSNKRKRYSSDEDEDDSDNSPDAQMAKSLQDEENAKVNMFENDDSDGATPRRTRRALRTIRPKSDYVEDFSEGEFDVKPNTWKGKSSSTTSSSKAKMPAAQSAKKSKIALTDSETSEFVISDSDDDFEIEGLSSPEAPLATYAVTRKAITQPTQSRMNVVVTQQSVSVRSRGTSSRDRGPTRGGSRIPLSRRGVSTASTLAQDNTEQTVTGLSDALAILVEDGAEFVAADQADDQDPSLFPSLLDDLSDLSDSDDDDLAGGPGTGLPRYSRRSANYAQHYTERRAERRAKQDRARLELHHPELLTMWEDLKNLPAIKTIRAEQPTNITRQLKPFQLEGLTWMKAMERTDWGGGLLGDEMGMGKTIQAVSLIMSDYPAKNPSLVLIPPVALMQWQQEIGDYTDGTLKTFVFHGTNKVTKGMSVKDLKKYDVILMSYNSLESMYRHQEKGFRRKEEVHFQKSVIHQIHFHRVILDEAHNIKVSTQKIVISCAHYLVHAFSTSFLVSETLR